MCNFWNRADRTCRFLIRVELRARVTPTCAKLRLQRSGRPFRIFYAFDPRRVAILLIGGDKTGDDRFYERYVPWADRLYDEHLAELK